MGIGRLTLAFEDGVPGEGAQQLNEACDRMLHVEVGLGRPLSGARLIKRLFPHEK